MIRLKRYLRWLFHTSGAALSLLLAVATTLLVGSCIALVVWVQSDASLDQALRLATNFLPGEQSLQTTGVTGSAKQGGKIDHLVWKQKQLTVEVQGLELSWDWQALLGGELRLLKAHAQSLRIENRNPPSKDPLPELPLPVHVDAVFSVDHVEWAGPPALQLEKLKGHYRFDGLTHFLQDASVDMAAGSYTGQAQLQAARPMALSAEVHGTVQTPLQVRQAPLTLVADASAKGTLLGADALIALQAKLQPQARDGKQPLGAMQASLQAQIRPSQEQPIASAQAQWSALDLATLWPQAPTTKLSGQAQVLPDAGGWKADVQVQNAAPGSVDKQHLPLNTAHALVLYRNGQWQLNELKAALAGGTLQAQGSYAGNQWSARGTLAGVRPEQIDSRLRFPALAGTFSAQQAAQGVLFETQLSSALQGGAGTQSLQLQTKGSWKANTLQLDNLQLQTPQAVLNGQLQVNTHTYASSATLRITMPGAEWTLDGSLAETTGQGTSELRMKDAHAFVQWLNGLPIVGAKVTGMDALGALEGSAKWSGGWQRQGQDMQVQAALKAQRLELRDNTARATQLSDVQLDLNGTLHAFTTQLKGKAQIGNTQFDLQAQSRGGQLEAGHWQARLETLRLAANNALYTTPWTMELQKTVELDWRQSSLQQSLRVAEGSLRLSGPAPGAATIQWQPVQWTHQGASDAAGSTRWNSRGQLQGLPLAWLELLGQTRLANLGLRGDLLFGGQWDASGGNALQLRANLQRTSGDLQLLGEQGANNLQAGLRDVHLNLAVDNDALRAELVWDSDAAGKAEAELATRVQTVDGSVTWGPDAPLQGKVRASLPRVGAWSLIAPVGWRIQGTLDADAQLSGTRANPIWKGNLSGNAMSVRSVVDGIDLSNGVLRLAVNGQHLEIVQLTLQGAGGATGGQLQISGSADWLPGAGGATATDAANRMRMALEAKAQGFRVSAKPDQRLVISGNLSAQLNNARLQVRGALKADQALFVLPEDTAPKLGSDVVVIRKVDPAKPKPPAAVSAPKLAQTVVPDINVTLDPGDNFLLQGHGLSTRLTGLLTLKAEGLHATPRLTGELHTVGGTYRAYGQLLNIEEGTLRFSGAYDNPSLSILALRPTSQQVVGVQIGGTAQLPVVRLYSDPDLSDADKLSWLVLGRASANGGAEAAMLQQAALSLIAGKGKAGGSGGLVSAIGLDEVSMGQASTTNVDGSTGTEATVKLGKRLSRDFYVSYERSLSGTFGTFYMFYDLSRRLTLRGESGAQSAVDLIFTTRFD